MKTNRKHVLVYNDNEGVCATINNGRARNPVMQLWAEQLFCLCRQWNIIIQAVWLGTDVNFIADQCSRIHEYGENSVLNNVQKKLRDCAADILPHMSL